MRACACYISYGNEDMVQSRSNLRLISREVEGRCEWGKAIRTNPHLLLRDFTSYCAATVTTAAALQTPAFVTATVLCFYVLYLRVCGVHEICCVQCLDHDHIYLWPNAKNTYQGYTFSSWTKNRYSGVHAKTNYITHATSAVSGHENPCETSFFFCA